MTSLKHRGTRPWRLALGAAVLALVMVLPFAIAEWHAARVTAALVPWLTTDQLDPPHPVSPLSVHPLEELLTAREQCKPECTCRLVYGRPYSDSVVGHTILVSKNDTPLVGFQTKLDGTFSPRLTVSWSSEH